LGPHGATPLPEVNEAEGGLLERCCRRRLHRRSRVNPRGRVLAERRSGVEVDAHLDDLASGGPKIMPLENGFWAVPVHRFP